MSARLEESELRQRSRFSCHLSLGPERLFVLRELQKSSQHWYRVEEPFKLVSSTSSLSSFFSEVLPASSGHDCGAAPVKRTLSPSAPCGSTRRVTPSLLEVSSLTRPASSPLLPLHDHSELYSSRGRSPEVVGKESHNTPSTQSTPDPPFSTVARLLPPLVLPVTTPPSPPRHKPAAPYLVALPSSHPHTTAVSSPRRCRRPRHPGHDSPAAECPSLRLVVLRPMLRETPRRTSWRLGSVVGGRRRGRYRGGRGGGGRRGGRGSAFRPNARVARTDQGNCKRGCHQYGDEKGKKGEERETYWQYSFKCPVCTVKVGTGEGQEPVEQRKGRRGEDAPRLATL